MKYQLVWQDIFGKDGKPDQTIWNLEVGGHGFGNDERQYYTDRQKNAFIKDHILHIVSYKEKFEQRGYTSAKLTTLNKKHIQYGRVEVLAKVPQGAGTWPAIWLLGIDMKDVGWPLCGEIDLMEHVGHNQDVIHFSLHSKNRYHHIKNQPTKVITVPNVSQTFHEYAFDWDEKGITFYLDGAIQASFSKKTGSTVEEWPFDHPFYLILNTAIGGTWGGTIDDSIFPTSFEFKYVKVYERSE